MSVKMTTDGRHILAVIPYYSGRGPSLAKEISGAKPVWDENVTPKKFLYWRYPLTMDTCRRFRQVFGQDLQVSNELADWARGELRRAEEIEEIREGWLNEGNSLEQVAAEAPGLFDAIRSRPYQMAGAAFLNAIGQGCLGDQPGLGKTLQTLATLIESDAKVILVGCRRTATRAVWEMETKRWAPSIKTFVAQGSRDEREGVMVAFRLYNKGRKMLITNIEMWRCGRMHECQVERNSWIRVKSKKNLQPNPPLPRVPWGSCEKSHDHKTINDPEWPYLHEQTWDALVLDESHNLLASTANFQSKRITQSRYGAVMIRRRLKKGGVALALSGTPFRSRLTKAWGTMNWCRPDVFGSYWRFAEAHFEVNQGRYGRVVSDEPLDLDAFNAALRPYYLARTKADAAPDLPPIEYAGTYLDEDENSLKGIWLEMEPKQAKAYRQMEADASAHIEGGRLLAVGVLAEITRLRQFACTTQKIEQGKVVPLLPSNKIEWILDFLHEREGNDGKVVIASSFTKLIHLIAATLRADGIEAMTLTGETSDRDRSSLVKRFADPADPCRVVVLNSRAGGESITLDAADDLIFTDLPWTSDEIDQVEARIHRVSRVHNVTVWRLFSLGTVDEWIAGMTEEQRELLRAAHPDAIRLAREALSC
jgi:Zierdtviridae DNA helicase